MDPLVWVTTGAEVPPPDPPEPAWEPLLCVTTGEWPPAWPPPPPPDPPWEPLLCVTTGVDSEPELGAAGAPLELEDVVTGAADVEEVEDPVDDAPVVTADPAPPAAPPAVPP